VFCNGCRDIIVGLIFAPQRGSSAGKEAVGPKAGGFSAKAFLKGRPVGDVILGVNQGRTK
jgi:hypothetical protein